MQSQTSDLRSQPHVKTGLEESGTTVREISVASLHSTLVACLRITRVCRWAMTVCWGSCPVEAGPR